MPKIDVYLEVGAKRVFASALRWPGWTRSGRDDTAALEALAGYADRYRSAVEPKGFPRTIDFEVVERVTGNATTDFGAPGIPASGDRDVLGKQELDRLVHIMESSWEFFTGTVERYRDGSLRKGPRGGGRDLDKIVAHVDEAEAAYLSSLGERPPRDGVRQAIVDALGKRARGEPWSRKTNKVWAPRYAIRRITWHVLDHAWEIEDRAS